MCRDEFWEGGQEEGIVLRNCCSSQDGKNAGGREPPGYAREPLVSLTCMQVQKQYISSMNAGVGLVCLT